MGLLGDLLRKETQSGRRSLHARRLYNYLVTLRGGDGDRDRDRDRTTPTPERFWFFDNDPLNFEGKENHPRVRCIQVPTPERTKVVALGSGTSGQEVHVRPVDVDGKKGAAVRRATCPDHRRIKYLRVGSIVRYDPRSGLTARILREFHPDRARQSGVREVFIDYDGTIAATDEGIPHITRAQLDDPTYMEALVDLLCGGRTRRRRVGAWMRALAEKGCVVTVLTANPTGNAIFARILRTIAPMPDANHWEKSWGGSGNGRRHIIHSDEKLDRIREIERTWHETPRPTPRPSARATTH